MFKRMFYTLILVVAFWPLGALSESCGDDTGKETAASGCSEAGQVEQGALFSYRGKNYREEELKLNIRQALYQLAEKYHQDRQTLLDSALWEIYLSQEEINQKKSKAELARELIGVERPSESQLQAFYDANKEKIPAPFEEVKERLASFIAQQQMLARQTQLVEKIKAEGQYKPLLEAPRPPIAIIDTDGYPSKGSMMASVEVVEFADYQCPHCKTGSEVMQRLKQQYGDKIRVVFMDFPINRSGISRAVAEGAVCADKQGKFWDYHDLAFEQQKSLSMESPGQLAETLQLDGKKFSDCLASESAKSKVARAKREGDRLGVDSTPTFFINGVKLHNHDQLEKNLSEAINTALKAAES